MEQCSIHRPTTRKKESVTELTVNGADIGRYSEHSRYPLPPFPERINVAVDGWNRYKLPSPSTGRLTAYTRATTVASTTPDFYNLNRWKIRTKVAAAVGVLDAAAAGNAQAIAFATRLRKAIAEDPSEKVLGRLIDEIDDEFGTGADAKELGGAVHDWIAELDMGNVLLHQIPEMFQPYALAYQNAMARAGFVAVPEYTERLVLNDLGSETIAGRLDGIARCVQTGELFVLDRKTSKTLDFSALEYGIQIGGVYAWSRLMLAQDRTEWEPMPEVNKDIALIAHVPSDQPERSQIVPISVWEGGASMVTALTVREERRSADKRMFGQTYPIPSAEAIRYVQARQALQTLRDESHASEIVAEYEDVWDDALTAFGLHCLELTNPDPDTES
jgi:hypothetical protein